MASICRNIQFRDFGRWKLSRLGLASNDRMAELIRRSFIALTFEELIIPTAVVATDLGTGEPYVFTSGGLIDAIRASCAFPGMFEPVQVGEHWLADGATRSEEHTSELQSLAYLVCRLLLEKK